MNRDRYRYIHPLSNFLQFFFVLLFNDPVSIETIQRQKIGRLRNVEELLE
jgi:hypothetical protein